jgi:hypothetical protein
MSDQPPEDDSDIDAAWERLLVDPVYRAKMQARIDAEIEDTWTNIACIDCGVPLLGRDDASFYCPNCDE